MEPLEERQVMAASGFEVSVNFQPASAATPAGYVADTGAPVGGHGHRLKYGWSADVSANAVQRHTAAAESSNTFIAMGRANWEMIVPNGRYSVNVTVGDPASIRGTYGVNLNGSPIISGTPTRKHHIFSNTTLVTVHNHRLILSSAAGAVGNKLDSVQIAAVSSTKSQVASGYKGNIIQAHGGQIIFAKGVYYWYGENKAAPTTMQYSMHQPRVQVIGVSCYSSTDLHHWKYRGLVLPGTSSGDLGPGNVLERPKVLYNAKTGKYVMWMHIDNSVYSKARVGVAVSSSPTGPFVYHGSFRPLGKDSRDMTVFQDTDGSTYLVFATDKNRSLRIARMTSDYLHLTGQSVQPFSGAGRREAPQLIKHSGHYFLIASGATWFAPNAAMYAVSNSVLGKYQKMGNPISGSGASTTYHSQGADAFQIGNTGQYVLLADRWKASDLGASSYAFMPLKFNGSKLTINWPANWALSVG